MQNPYQRFLVAGLCAALVLGGAACSNLPGTRGQQGAAIGGLGGAATGALIGGHEHRLLGALLGGALGAGGGYLIGANSDRITGKDTPAAETAVRRAQDNPATPQQAKTATTADLNADGFVTMDEVVAMKQAGFSNQEILDKMQATGQVFELTSQQQDYLRNNGVDQSVINQIPNLNRNVRDRILGQGTQTATPPPTGAPRGTAPVYTPGPNTPVPPPPGP